MLPGERGGETKPPEETHILHCVQQDAGDLLPVCAGQHLLLLCGLLERGGSDTSRLDKVIKTAALSLAAVRRPLRQWWIGHWTVLVVLVVHYGQAVERLCCLWNHCRRSLLPGVITF